MKTGALPRMSHNFESQKKMINKIIATGSYVHNVFSSHLKPFGLSLEQYNVLEILRAARPHPVTFTHIQEQMNNKSSNVTRLVDRLVEWEYVSRDLNPQHRRKMDIAITKKGMQVVQRIDETIPQLFAKFEHLGKEEVAQINALLSKVKQ